MANEFETRLNRALINSSFATDGDPLYGNSGANTLTVPLYDANSSEIYEGSRVLGRGGNDSITGGFGSDILFGQGGNDVISGGFGIARDYLIGGDGNDRLSGGGGDDILYGGNGSDRVEGGLDSDRIVLSTRDSGRDEIVQFISGSDLLLVELTLAQKQAGATISGAINADEFVRGARATTSEHRFIYDPAARTLAFDNDGNGPAAVRVLVFFTYSTEITATDISVVSSYLPDNFPMLG